MATIDDLLNAQAYRRAAMAEGLAMGKDTRQPGGIPNRPYDAPKEDPNNPYVPAPPRRDGLMIANEGASSPVKIYEGESIEDGKRYKRVLPDYGGAGINYDKIRFKPGFSPLDLAHHTEHFGDGGGEGLIDKVLSDPTLDESDYKRILGPDYKKKIQQSQQQSLLISGGPFTGGGYMTNDGFGVNLQGDVFRQNRDGSFDYLGPYTEDRFGPLIPGGGPNIDLAKKKNKMTIA